MMDKRLAASEDYLEPELLSPGGGTFKPRGEEPRPQLPPEKPGLLTRLKMLIAGGLALIGIVLYLVVVAVERRMVGARG